METIGKIFRSTNPSFWMVGLVLLFLSLPITYYFTTAQNKEPPTPRVVSSTQLPILYPAKFGCFMCKDGSWEQLNLQQKNSAGDWYFTWTIYPLKSQEILVQTEHPEETKWYTLHLTKDADNFFGNYENILFDVRNAGGHSGKQIIKPRKPLVPGKYNLTSPFNNSTKRFNIWFFEITK